MLFCCEIDRLVDVGGFNLHLTASGEGNIPVILEGGVGECAHVWCRVVQLLASFAQVITYDRAGYASSGAGNARDRTAKEAAANLYRLLVAADVQLPVILVGHAYGAFVARLFAAQHPQLVAGMVLVDVIHEHQWTSRFPKAQRQLFRRTARRTAVLAVLASFGLARWGSAKTWPTGSLGGEVPPSVREDLRRCRSARGTLCTAYHELASLPESAIQVQRADSMLGNKPLVVVRHGLPSPAVPGVSMAIAGLIEELTAKTQAELTKLSATSVLMTAARSGYDVHMTEPELVAQAVPRILETLRGAGSPPES